MYRINMLSYKSKYISYLIAMNAILAAILIEGGNILFKYGRSIGGIALAMAMFFLFELFVILFTEKKYKTINAQQSITLFLGFKAVKIIISLLFIAIYAILVKVDLKRFVLVFVALYFIYLLFDTVYLMSREKNAKKNSTKINANKKEYKLKEIGKLSNYYKK